VKKVRVENWTLPGFLDREGFFYDRIFLQKRGVTNVSDFPTEARRRKPPDPACPILHLQSSPACLS